jgi:hypothetical protein
VTRFIPLLVPVVEGLLLRWPGTTPGLYCPAPPGLPVVGVTGVVVVPAVPRVPAVAVFTVVAGAVVRSSGAGGVVGRVPEGTTVLRPSCPVVCGETVGGLR